MFKLGVITDEISQDIEIAAGLAEKYGLNGLEIRSVWEKGPHELNESDISRIKEVLHKHGLECCGISAPFFKCDIDSDEEYNEQIEILKKCINLAKKLETKYIRGFTFWQKGNFEDNLPKIVQRFKQPIQILEQSDMYLLLEMDPTVFASNGKKLAKTAKAINSDRVHVLWDPGNDIYEPDGETPYPDGYEYVKDMVKHVHIKDAIRLPDGKAEGVVFGTGDVDFEGQLKSLKKDGYDGYLVMETHYRPKHEISEELMALPKGSAFSLHGYEATEECLISFKKLLVKLNLI